MSEALVSIIIPTYNRKDMLLRTLDSVQKQTYKNWEAIIVDDGSTDGTGALFGNACEDKRLRYIWQQNAGVSAARNTGILQARGEFIAFLDSDDLWHPWKVELQVLALESNPDVGMVWTDMEAIDSNGTVVSPRYLRKFYSSYNWFSNETLFSEHRPLPALENSGSDGILHVGDIYCAMLTGNLVHTSTSMSRRTRLTAVGFFNEDLKPSGEDYEFHLRTCWVGLVGFLDVVSTSYRIGAEDQLTQPRYATAMAENYVYTVVAALKNNKRPLNARFRKLIYNGLAGGYSWAAIENLRLGRVRKARGYFANAIRYGRHDLRTIAFFGASIFLGKGTINVLAAYKKAKNWAVTTLGGDLVVPNSRAPYRIKRSRRAAVAFASRLGGITWGIGRLPQKPSLLVITYHSVCDVATIPGDPNNVSTYPDMFERQMKRLKRSFPVVKMDEAIAHVSSPKASGAVVLVTFDDGCLDNYTIAFPILRALSVPATFFLTPGFIGKEIWPWWDRIVYAVRNSIKPYIRLETGEEILLGESQEERLRASRKLLAIYRTLPDSDAVRFVEEIVFSCQATPPKGIRRFLDWDEAKEMQAAGMDIGSHCLTHQVLARMPVESQNHELAESKRILENTLGCAIRSCAYPVGVLGTFDESTMRGAETAGYRAAFTFDHQGFNAAPSQNMFSLSRLAVGLDMTADLLELRLKFLSTTGQAQI